MRLFDFRRAADLKIRGRPQEGDGGPLKIDDLLSSSSDALGLTVDAEGRLLLVEGSDVD